MPRTSLAVSALLAALVATGALAQPRLDRGAKELSIHVSPDFESPIGDAIDARAGFGWFVRDGFALRATLEYGLLEDVAAEESDFRTFALSLGVELHFRRRATVVPYAGAAVGWRSTNWGELERDGAAYGPRAGLKVFLADNVALDIGLAYDFASADVFVDDFIPVDTDLYSLVGLRVLF